MTESLAKLSSMIESAKDLTIEAAMSARSRLADTPVSLRPLEVSKLLNSRIDRENLNGMKYVISLMGRGEDGLPYFADVVKNVTSSNEKVKKLVLIYLTRYAEKDPDTALLSINSIQKALNDKNAVSRAAAIRAMAGIRISSITPILLICIKRTMTDQSPLVRASTAIAIGKVYDIYESKKQLLANLFKLMADSDTLVVAAALKTYHKLSPTLPSLKRWVPIHGNFRRLCSILPLIDEWSQGFIIELLTVYARTFLPKPKLRFEDDDLPDIELPDDYTQIPKSPYTAIMDTDLQLFIDSLKTLIYSSSEFVLLAFSRALIHLTPPKIYKESGICQSLIRLASDSTNKHVSFFSLQTIYSISSSDATIFDKFFKKFYVYPTDGPEIAKTKLLVLSRLVNEDNIKYVWEELKYYSLKSHDEKTSSEAIKAIGHCSQITPYWGRRVLSWCMKQISKTTGQALNELLTIIRYLIQQIQSSSGVQDKQEIMKTVYRLSTLLETEASQLEGNAKAGIIWIIGEFTEATDNVFGPDVLRTFIKNFAYEEEKVRYELLVLAAKSVTYELDKLKGHFDYKNHDVSNFTEEGILFKMFLHILYLSSYDPSYDIRDRARLFHVLLNTGNQHFDLASLFLRVPKPVPHLKKDNVDFDNTSLYGSVLLSKYLTLPPWSDPETLPPFSIRKPVPVHANNLGGNVVSISSSSQNNSSKISASHGLAVSLPQQVEVLSKQTYNLQSLDEFFGASSDELDEEVLDSDGSSTVESAEVQDSDEESEEDSDDDGNDELDLE